MDTTGMIQPFEYTDEVTGDRIRFLVSDLYSKLMINKREYYFIRETGEFDGTGQSMINGPYLVEE